MRHIKTLKNVVLLSFGFKGDRRKSLGLQCGYGSRIWRAAFFHWADSNHINRGLQSPLPWRGVGSPCVTGCALQGLHQLSHLLEWKKRLYQCIN